MSQIADRMAIEFPVVCFDELKAIDEFCRAREAKVTYQIGFTTYSSLSELPLGHSYPQIVVQAYKKRGKTSILLASVCVTGTSIDVKLHRTSDGPWFGTLCTWLSERHDLLQDERIRKFLEQNPNITSSVWLMSREELMEKFTKKPTTGLTQCWDKILKGVAAVIMLFFKN